MLTKAWFNMKEVRSINCNAFASAPTEYAMSPGAIDPGLMYFSGIDSDKVVREIATELKSNKKEGSSLVVEVQYGRHKLFPEHCEILTAKIPNSEFSHIIIHRKDEVINQNQDDELICIYVYHKELFPISINAMFIEQDWRECMSDELIDKFYDKFYKYAPVYVDKKWIPYILYSAAKTKAYFFKSDCHHYHSDEDSILAAYSLQIPTKRLIDIISIGLKNKEIFIKDNSDKVSEDMLKVDGLDKYLEKFVDSLALKIQGSFDPYFNPSIDNYSNEVVEHNEYVSYMDHIDLFPAQKAVVQSCVNAFKDGKKNLYFIGEMGVGKTNVSISTIMADYGKLYGMTNIIMCPGTLCNKWKRTIEAESPFAEVHIVTGIKDLVTLSNKILDKDKRYNLWLVISKDRMKSDYAIRPAARWRRNIAVEEFPYHVDTYVCPDCGQPLFTLKTEGRGKRAKKIRSYFNAESFTSKSVTNSRCMNMIKKYNTKTHAWESVPCNAPLWTPCVKKEEDEFKGDSVEWVKVGADMGWVQPMHMKKLSDNYLNPCIQHSQAVRKKGLALLDTLEGEGITQTAPRSYCLSKYIRKHFKNCITYAVIDEVHELSGENTLQGEAMGDIVKAAKKSICLTGTLLNGYAKSIFYMLFRTHPRTMIKEGFTYDKSGEVAFTKAFGVYKHSEFELIKNAKKKNSKSSSIKALPGASPLIYTKFLMNNAVFACIDDMAEGLPGYKEIPVPVHMDYNMRASYDQMALQIKSAVESKAGRFKTMAQVALMMTVWPDQPYKQPPITSPDTKDVLYMAPELSSTRSSEKDDKCLEIIREKVAKGEKIMVYYSYPGRTDVDVKLSKLLNEEGIKTSVLLSKKPDSLTTRIPKWMGTPSAADREAWINDQLEKGCQVLFVNPKLVQTGLDLLEFSTIIFYQTGYSLSEMRQASRRSWRLGQTKDVEVYYLYYEHTVQETIMSLMATKLHAAMAIEGKFSEEGLQAMSNNTDILSQVAASVVEGVQEKLDINAFSSSEKVVKNEELVSKKKILNKSDVLRNYKYDVSKRSKIKKHKITYSRFNEVAALNRPDMLFNAI